MPSRHRLYFGGFVVSLALFVGASLVGLVDGLSALSGGIPASEEFILLAMLGAAAEWVGIVLVLAVVATLFLTATSVSVLRTASLPRDDRLVSIVNWFEQRYPILRQFDVSKRVEPTAEDRQQHLQQQYIEGEITEAEFERKMEQIMDDTVPEKASRSRTELTVDINDKQR